MTRLPNIVLLLVCVAGCSGSRDSSSSDTAASSMVNPNVRHGRVSLIGYKIESGNPDADAVRIGVDNATSVLNELLQADNELTPAKGTFAGRFRLEDEGTVRMFLTSEATAIENADDSKLTDAFVGAVFGGKCSFPKLGDIGMVYVEFEIAAPE